MAKLRAHSCGVSIDGYGAGPDQSAENPIGTGGSELHKWFFATRTFHDLVGGRGEGSTRIDDDFAARGFVNIGAWILGRNMFGPVHADVDVFGVGRDGYFSASHGFLVYRNGGIGRNGLTWFDRSGKPSRAMDDALLNDIEIAPDGRAFAATRLDPRTLVANLWVTDLVRGTTTRLTHDREYLVVQGEPQQTQIILLENWLSPVR